MADYSEDYRDYELDEYADPSPFNISTELVPGCSVCNRKDDLSRCAACKVVHYCSREHQAAHRKEHKSICNKIKKAQQVCDKEEAELRASQGGPLSWANPFETAPGHFWGIMETRPYMRARFAVVDFQMKINTRAAVQAALDNIMDMLRLCRGDNMGLRDIAPGLLLRLGRDQACYDFVKWWEWRYNQSDYDSGDMDAPYLDVKDADVFEAPDLSTNMRFPNLSPLLNITLLKIRLLIDLKALQRVKLEAGSHVPQEILDTINAHAVSSVVAGNREVLERKDLAPQISELEEQIRKLYDTVQKANKYIWVAMIKPGNHLTVRPAYTSAGTIREMQLKLQYVYNAWSETPGAIGVIEELQKRSGAARET